MPRNASPTNKAMAALARAFAHDNALSFPHRRQESGDIFLANYAETQGAHQAQRMHKAFRRLSQEDRKAIADDLLQNSLLDGL